MHTTIADKDFSAFLFCDVIQFYMKGHKQAIKYLQLHKFTSSGVLGDSLKYSLNEMHTAWVHPRLTTSRIVICPIMM